MENKFKVAVMGCGHIGSYAVRAARLAPDMDLMGVVELESCLGKVSQEFPGVLAVKDIRELPGKPDVIVLTVPSRMVEKTAPALLEQGIRTVDCFDIHGEPFMHLRGLLDPAAKATAAASIMGAGVDPGMSTVIRALFEVWAPTGLTYVTYGPGMSMGHTVAAKSYKGVKDALSITRPGDPGCHNRDLYLELEPGVDFEQVKTVILADPYFAHDSVRVFQVADVTPLVDMGHAIQIHRKGGASGVDNQLLNFDTTFHNPASTAQVMIAAARAVMRMSPGAYTMLEIPPLYYLPYPLEEIMQRIV